MAENNLKNDYKKKGYIIGERLLEDNQITNLRNLISNVFREKGDPANLVISDFENKILEDKIIKLFYSKEILDKINLLSEIYNTEISLLPHFEIMLNHHTSRSVSLGIGWHRDCNGELKYNECRKWLKSDNYVFGKVGIYFQVNGDFGGSIDLIPESHKDIQTSYLNFKKIFNFLLLKSIMKFPFKKNIIFTRILEPLSFLILNAIKLKPYPGQFILFDSRVLHRGSPVAESKTRFITQLKEKSNDFFETPEAYKKIAIYCQYGSKLGVKSYMRDRINRSDIKEDVLWKKQIEIVKQNINKNLAHLILSFIK